MFIIEIREALMKTMILKMALCLSMLSFVSAKENENNMEKEKQIFYYNRPISIYKLIVNPEKFVNKLVIFSGFWSVTIGSSSGMIYPNKDFIKFPDKYTGINIYLKNESIGNLDHSCDYEYFAIQGKFVKKRHNYAVIDASVRIFPDDNENGKTMPCKIGRSQDTESMESESNQSSQARKRGQAFKK